MLIFVPIIWKAADRLTSWSQSALAVGCCPGRRGRGSDHQRDKQQAKCSDDRCRYACGCQQTVVQRQHSHADHGAAESNVVDKVDSADGCTSLLGPRSHGNLTHIADENEAVAYARAEHSEHSEDRIADYRC